MLRKRHKAEEIVTKLRRVEVLTSQGRSVAEAIRSIGVTGFVVICGSIDFQDAAGPTNRNVPFLTNRIDQLALPSRP
jgi:putative transposase